MVEYPVYTTRSVACGKYFIMSGFNMYHWCVHVGETVVKMYVTLLLLVSVIKELYHKPVCTYLMKVVN